MPRSCIACALALLVTTAGCSSWSVDGAAWQARRPGGTIAGVRSDGTRVVLRVDQLVEAAPIEDQPQVKRRRTRKEIAGTWLTGLGVVLSAGGAALALDGYINGRDCSVPTAFACQGRANELTAGVVISSLGDIVSALVGPLMWMVGGLLAPSPEVR